ncbi:nicotinamide-nucleotide amidase [Marinobacter sp. SS21]|uniref:nicotinamide-nucleotide amidase n=1 Tax=Marinobacter sp. SS21 TaxID=2979460 RepID=UPI00232CDCE6|nr:nicotinamide-nucleotide amidase [Marinobacter sp. SS21]MDC0663763.1 nicotinamide-nucleotide amidase [Marinobacter sp. SS21]
MTISDQQLADAGADLGAQLVSRGMTIATAESCTGGWLAKVLTDRAGSSAYVAGGLVTYSNRAKQLLLGVTELTLQQHGAVSEQVVRDMVAGALRATGAEVAVAISGVAGPGGGSAEKPVGTVWFAWGAHCKDTVARHRRFEGDREAVRRQAVMVALQGVSDFLDS